MDWIAFGLIFFGVLGFGILIQEWSATLSFVTLLNTLILAPLAAIHIASQLIEPNTFGFVIGEVVKALAAFGWLMLFLLFVVSLRLSFVRHLPLWVAFVLVSSQVEEEKEKSVVSVMLGGLLMIFSSMYMVYVGCLRFGLFN